MLLSREIFENQAAHVAHHIYPGFRGVMEHTDSNSKKDYLYFSKDGAELFESKPDLPVDIVAHSKEGVVTDIITQFNKIIGYINVGL